MSDGIVDAARVAASEFLGAYADEVIFGANTTTLNFALSRTVSREWGAGDEVVATKLDHDANISPWLELAHDKGITVHLCDFDGEGRLDLDQLRSLVYERTRVVAFPWASNALGTVTPVEEIVAIAHEAGALAWCDAVHYAPHGPIDLQKVAVDVLLCSPYKFYGPHLGVAAARRELLESWRPYKVRPAPELPVRPPLRDGHARARAALRLHRGGRVRADDELEVHRASTSGRSGSASSTACPTAGRCTARRRWRAASRPSRSRTPRSRPRPPPSAWPRPASRSGTANYYALEVMKHLGLEDGAIRVGIVHYNTEDEVDRLLAELGA